MKLILTSILCLFAVVCSAAPRVVVGVHIEGLRQDCLELFWNGFGNSGFKKLTNIGLRFNNARYPIQFSDAVADLAVISTATHPFINGISAGSRFDRQSRKYVEIAASTTAKAIGSDRAYIAECLQAPTWADRIYESNYGLSKILSAAVAPQTAVIQGGHSGQCFWVDNLSGKWTSSSYYMDALPEWVTTCEDLGTFCSQRWQPILPAGYYATYKGSIPFSYDLKAACNGLKFYENLATSPFANDFVCDFVLKAIDEEKIGADLVPDAVCIGLNARPFFMKEDSRLSMELEDAYLRLDKTLGNLITALESRFGKDGFALYIVGTRSQIGEMTPRFASKNLQWKSFGTDRYYALLNSYLKGIYGVDGLVQEFALGNIYLDHKKIESSNLNLFDVQQSAADFLFMTGGILQAATARNLSAAACSGNMPFLPFNRTNSGDVMYSLMPFYYEENIRGKLTGYCAQENVPVPLFIYGSGAEIKAGLEIDDISSLMQIVELICSGR